MTPTTNPNRWLHAWAVLTVGLVFVQLLLGSVVTTFDVGMADPEWPTAPWYLAQVHVGTENLGKLIEHTHRAFGSIVGLAVIVLAVWLWLREPRPALRWAAVAVLLPMVATLFLGLVVVKDALVWLVCLALCVLTPLALLPWVVRPPDSTRWLRWLGTVALAGVIVQGLFGGFRVCWHVEMGPELRVVHGVFAQVYFAFIVCLAGLIGPARGLLTAPTRRETSASLRRWSLLLPLLVLGQLVLGALLRHTLSTVWERMHVLTAFLVAFGVMMTLALVYKERARDAGARNLALVLMALLTVQIALGVEALVERFSAGRPPETVVTTLGQAVVRTGHVLAGALILSSSSALALFVRRPAAAPTPPAEQPEPARELEGVA